MKILKTLTVLCIFGMSSHASVFKVFDVLVNSVQFEKVMTTNGIYSRSVISETKKNIKFSLGDLSSNGEMNMTTLKKVSRLIKDPKDKIQFNEMIKILNKDSSKVSKDELVGAINSLVFLSQRYGLKKRSILACAPCVNQELSEAGFKFTLNELKDSSSKKIFSIMRRKAKNPLQSAKFINSEVRKQKIGRNANVKAHEEEALIYMLLVPKYGTRQQKGLFEAIKKVSKNKAGKVDFFDKENSHKFYNLFSNKMTSADINFWEDLLIDTSKTMKDGDMSTMDAFYLVLEKRAKNSSDEVERDDLMAKLDFLKTKKCFSN